MSSYGSTKVIYVISPPAAPEEREKFYNWLKEHGRESGENLQYPFLLITAQFSGSHDTWENELSAMNVELYSENLAMTDAPEEMVYILGRPDYGPKDMRNHVRYVKWLKNHTGVDLREAKDMASGRNPVRLGTIIVHDTRDRLPIMQEIEQFGRVRLDFVDIRNPWVD